MDEIQKIIAMACLKHYDSGMASFDREARLILQALEENGYKVVKIISSNLPVIKSVCDVFGCSNDATKEIDGNKFCDEHPKKQTVL